MNEGKGLNFEKPVEGDSNDWWTPPEIVQCLGGFDLDPCGGVRQAPLAARTITLPWTPVVRKKEEAQLCQHEGCAVPAEYECQCSIRACSAHAREHAANCGILVPWKGRVFCNPPYGPHVNVWAEKMAAHCSGVLLIFARVETKAWHGIWAHADAILFPFRRITFHKPDGSQAKSGTAPSALVAYGLENVEALRLCGIEGALVEYASITSPQGVPLCWRGKMLEVREVKEEEI
jgi:hypothetical protein